MAAWSAEFCLDKQVHDVSGTWRAAYRASMILWCLWQWLLYASWASRKLGEKKAALRPVSGFKSQRRIGRGWKEQNMPRMAIETDETGWNRSFVIRQPLNMEGLFWLSLSLSLRIFYIYILCIYTLVYYGICMVISLGFPSGIIPTDSLRRSDHELLITPIARHACTIAV